MDEIMAVKEIEKRFDSEWVLLEDPTYDEQLRVLNGKVVCHSRDRDEVYRKAAELRLKHSAFLYTGTMPEDMEFIL